MGVNMILYNTREDSYESKISKFKYENFFVNC
jgi:hypothetical protein